MQSDHYVYDKGTFLISVDRYENGEMRGAYYHPIRGEGGDFRSLIHLLLQMERSMEQENLPQSFQAARSFCPAPLLWNGGDACRFLSGREATFAITVRFRRHSSWQGEVVCKGDGGVWPFRSVLELIGLMDGILEGRAQPVLEDA